MIREKALKILMEEQRSFKCLQEVSKDKKTREHFKEKVQAYEFAINQLAVSPPKVVIHEFLDCKKIWRITVEVDGELIANEDIDFISDRDSKENGQGFRNKMNFENIIRKWFKKGRK